MALFIGNIDRAKLANYIYQKKDKYRIYGVDFTANFNKSVSASNPRTCSDFFGTRTYTSEGYNFEPSTTVYSGVDNFLDDNAKPFQIRECLTRYNSSIGQQEVYCYEGDSNFTPENRSSGEYNVMIEFPLFYYCRPSRYEFLISEDPISGFIPSPMHYRGGTLYNKIYISKYCLNEDAKSLFLTTSKQLTSVNNLISYRTLVREQGMYILDFKAYFSLVLLFLVKYAVLEPTLILSAGKYMDLGDLTGDSELLLSKDGYIGSSLADGAGYTKSAFGLEDFTARIRLFIDGICSSASTNLYINDDIESIVDMPDTTTYLGYTLIDNLGIGYAKGSYNSLTYNQNYPYLLFPSGNSNTSMVEYFITNPSYTHNTVQLVCSGGSYGSAYTYFFVESSNSNCSPLFGIRNIGISNLNYCYMRSFFYTS